MKTFEQLVAGDTPNIHSILEPDELTMRSVLVASFLNTGSPISLSALTSHLEALEIDVHETIKNLTDKGLIVTQDGGMISGLYPFSAVPTRHKVQLNDGRTFFAMCAIDSLGIAHEMEEGALITSSCALCNIPITVEILKGKISSSHPQTSRAVHVALSEYKDWAGTC
ncbi:MAG: organomercurial lyase [Desulforhopalus sp.]